MAKKKWRANSNVPWDERSFFQRFGWPLVAVVVVAGLASFAWYRYSNAEYKYGDNGYQEGQEMSKCIQDRTRQSADNDMTDAAASACVRQQDSGEDKNLGP
jgi:hypothetical protein